MTRPRIIQVSLTPEVTSRGVRRAVIRELVIQHQDTELGRKLPVYDGNKVTTICPFVFRAPANQRGKRF